jgi:hypothetical protein
MIAPANAKNGSPAAIARRSTKKSLHFRLLDLFKLPAIPFQFGESLPSWASSSGWSYRNSLVVEYWNRFFELGGKRF